MQWSGVMSEEFDAAMASVPDAPEEEAGEAAFSDFGAFGEPGDGDEEPGMMDEV